MKKLNIFQNNDWGEGNKNFDIYRLNTFVPVLNDQLLFVINLFVCVILVTEASMKN